MSLMIVLLVNLVQELDRALGVSVSALAAYKISKAFLIALAAPIIAMRFTIFAPFAWLAF